MEKEAKEQTAVLLTPGKGCNDDVLNVITRERNKNFGTKKCNIWLLVCLLCILLGCSAGFILRPYLDDKYEKCTSYHDDLNTSPNGPEKLTQHHNPMSGDRVDDSRDDIKNAVLNDVLEKTVEDMTGVPGLSNLQRSKLKDNSDNVYLSVGMRNDYLIQACGEAKLKQSFPDVDYALFGYNSLKGFPLSVGHDPGFTFPIFVADYSKGRQSADCRYSIPQGLVIVPDVSCVTSFSSKVIKSEAEFSSSLSVNAHVQGSAYGASFSLSAGYQTAKSEFEKKERVYILSTAECKYYFSKFVAIEPPEFHPDFIRWVRTLEGTNDTNTYIRFFDTFGTHYPTETTFGARYTYEHSMNQSEFKKKQKQSANIQMSASYSGAFSIGGGFGLSAEQKQMATNFSQDIETKTFTVGASPPADGDAMKWASSVQLNPVPVTYSLDPIENLFTDNFMGSLNINFQHIHRHLLKYKLNYYEYLFYSTKLEYCPAIQKRNTVLMKHTRLVNRYDIQTYSFCDCMKSCVNETECIAVSFLGNQCLLYNGNGNGHHLRGNNATNWVTVLLPKQDTQKTALVKSKVIGEELEEKIALHKELCEVVCETNGECVAVTYTSRLNSCKLYRRENIGGLQHDSHSDTVFFHRTNLPVVK